MITMTYTQRLAAWRAQHDAAVTYSQPAAWTYAQVRTMPVPDMGNGQTPAEYAAARRPLDVTPFGPESAPYSSATREA